jgi:hypothetical protein
MTPRPIEMFFSLPVERMTSNERVQCLTLYALYFNRDGLSAAALDAVIGGWIAEFGSEDAAIEALRDRVEKQKAHA